jgi:hypothetical protein
MPLKRISQRQKKSESLILFNLTVAVQPEPGSKVNAEIQSNRTERGRCPQPHSRSMREFPQAEIGRPREYVACIVKQRPANAFKNNAPQS